MDALDKTKFAILCLTTRNMAAPWLMFEAGAAAGRFRELKLAPLVLDGELKDLVDPLARFNGVTFGKSDIQSLFRSINESLGKPLTEKMLVAGLGLVWDKLQPAVAAALLKDTPDFDVFLSAPMAAFKTDAEYIPFRTDVLQVIKTLRESCRLTVFCALEAVTTIKDFDTCGVSAHDDFDKLEHCANFLLLYPGPLVTSALFEAGYALARGMPCRFFVKSPQDLPFLMRELPEAFTNVSILDNSEWATYGDICKKIVKSQKQWFRKRLRARFIA